MYALDTLMCHVENDLEELNPAKRAKKESFSSESDDENSSDTYITDSD